MNADQALRMITRLLMRKLMRKGVNAGMKSVFGDNQPRNGQDKALRSQSRNINKLSRMARRIR